MVLIYFLRAFALASWSSRRVIYFLVRPLPAPERRGQLSGALHTNTHTQAVDTFIRISAWRSSAIVLANCLSICIQTPNGLTGTHTHTQNQRTLNTMLARQKKRKEGEGALTGNLPFLPSIADGRPSGVSALVGSIIRRKWKCETEKTGGLGRKMHPEWLQKKKAHCMAWRRARDTQSRHNFARWYCTQPSSGAIVLPLGKRRPSVRPSRQQKMLSPVIDTSHPFAPMARELIFSGASRQIFSQSLVSCHQQQVDSNGKQQSAVENWRMGEKERERWRLATDGAQFDCSA